MLAGERLAHGGEGCLQGRGWNSEGKGCWQWRGWHRERMGLGSLPWDCPGGLVLPGGCSGPRVVFPAPIWRFLPLRPAPPERGLGSKCDCRVVSPMCLTWGHVGSGSRRAP